MIREHDVTQGTDEWLELRRGILTASEMHKIITPPPEPETRIKKGGEPYKQPEWNPVADNEKVRAHLYELLAQRVSGFVEPQYISDAMLRGSNDEIEARALYGKAFAPVREVGFITNDRWGFTIGYSPDGMVGDKGLIEAKSREQRFQVKVVIKRKVPKEHVMQLQTGLLVSEREWIDYVSYCGGLPMMVLRVYPDPVIQNALVEVAGAFERTMRTQLAAYHDSLATHDRFLETERLIEQEIHL